MNIDNRFSETKDYIRTIESKFIDQYIPVDPSIGPDQYEIDVRSYLILCHAAFEELMENIAIYLFEESYILFLQNKITKPLVTILNLSGEKLKIPDVGEKEIKSFDNIRKTLDEAKSNFSSKVFDNHGASLKYMRSLFYPVALDIPDDTRLITAIDWIAEYRGSYAHKRNGKKPPSPENCKEYVNDSIQLCEKLIYNAKIVLQ